MLSCSTHENMANPVIIAAIAVLSLFVAVAQGQKLERFEREYGPFNWTYLSIFEIEAPATISNNALQLTPDTASTGITMLTNNSGRVLLKQRFKLWEGDNISSNVKQAASFNTSFLINIFRIPNDTWGEGLAFVIAPDLSLPPNSYGEFLGLTNSTTDGDPENKIVAVELDTFKQDFDPDNNHVGIDINSVRSTKFESLTPHNITLAPIGVKFYNVWIDYSGSKMVMDVYIAEQLTQGGSTPPKPGSPIVSADLNLRQHVNQYSYFGFSASTGNATQLNSVLRWNLTVDHFPDDNPWLKIGLGVGVPVLVLLVMGVLGLGYYLHSRRMALSNPNVIGALKSLPGTPREFRFRDLKKATNSFDDKNKLRQGGYGMVYRGFLAKENLEIAVKKFSRESIKGQDDFLAELTIINRLRHKHLVKLLGWCYRSGKLLLVYEYMPNGSLDKHLFAGPNIAPLRWDLRYNIISGVASALLYLHNEFEQRVVHRDLKGSNIMLDSNFNARLGDFGLAQALENEKTSYAEAEGVLGTMGYIAPECFHTGKATQQSDVYAFGAVILEVVCGLRPGAKIDGFQLLVDWVWFLHRDEKLLEVVDQRLGDDYDEEEARRLLLLGLACSHPTASERPKTQAILEMIISKTVPVPVVQPFKPAFVWPVARPIDLDSAEMVSNAEEMIAARIRAQHERRSQRRGGTGAGSFGPIQRRQAEARPVPIFEDSRDVQQVEYSDADIPEASKPRGLTGLNVIVAQPPPIPIPPPPSRMALESSSPFSVFESGPGEFSRTFGRKISLPYDQSLLQDWDGDKMETYLHHCALQTSAIATSMSRSFTYFRDTIESSMQAIREREETIEKMTSEMGSMKLSAEEIQRQYEESQKQYNDLSVRHVQEMNSLSREYLARGITQGRQQFINSEEYRSSMENQRRTAVADFRGSSEFEGIVYDQSTKFLRTGFFRCQAQCITQPGFPPVDDWSFLDPSRRVDLEGVTCDDE